ncbi:MAG: beta-N-acetylhexosaminidase [Anaerolineae bacterium]|nr:beta-N-acetylhexosaminidase [Anaerolineae bacterium]
MASERLSIIPQPVSIERMSGAFVLTPQTAVLTDSANTANGRYLQALFSLANNPDGLAIHLNLNEALKPWGDEGYRLEITTEAVRITAVTTTGIFYGIQTLRQLLPAGQKTGTIPCLLIEDKPRFSWRGFMLDEGRHFQGKTSVLRLLDAMALLKLNRFHWHLTEDQGWRLEIKQYPRLTAVGAQRAGTAPGMIAMVRGKHNGVPHGGFYTQDEVREVVAYAAERHITVVPEIEMPGHSTAALVAYPELGCTGGPYEMPTRFGIFKDVYCVGKDHTITFLEHVLAEVLALFPSPYIHIGGDEAPRSRWQKCPDCQKRIADNNLGDEHGLQLYLTNHMARFLRDNGRSLIGWNEILNADLEPSAVAQYWVRNRKGMIAAIENGRSAILSPNWHYYLDYSYSLTALSKTYNHEPVFSELSQSAAKNILGIEAPLWTEFVPTAKRMGYQAFPRLTAVAETAWTPAAQKELVSFRERLPAFLNQLDEIGLTYAPLTEIEPAKLKQKLGIFSMIRP